MDKRLANAYAEGYDLGLRYARQYLKGVGKKININYTPTSEELEMVELDCGGMLNLGGRSLPF